MVGRRVVVGDIATAEATATVLAIRDVGCPLSKKYGPRIASIEDEYATRGVEFVYLNLSGHNDAEQVEKEIAGYGFDGRYVHDPKSKLGPELGVTSTTEVFVLDSARTLVYRGAIDDQYGIGYARQSPRETYLRDALDAVLDGRPVEMAATTAPGCALKFDTPSQDSTGVTYHNRISRIVQANCLSCHRSGGVAPFSLESYKDVAGRRTMIRFVVNERLMPPWHMDEADGLGPWANDRSLSSSDREALISWALADCPEGDPADAPLARAFTSGWEMGEPDAVVQLPRAFDVPAEGAMDYQYAWIQTDFGEDKWVEAIEFRPTAPEVVHHALVFVEEPRQEGESRREYRRRWQGGLRGYFGGLVPGQGPRVFPEGVARKLPAGAWLKFQMHYTPNGTATSDRTEVAFRFTDAPPKHEMQAGSAFTNRFRIPAGADDHQVQAETVFRSDSVLYSFAPHMHLRGKAFRYELVHPDGQRETIADIPRYDFNWQTSYQLLEPRRIAAGTRLVATAWFDNSDMNPANPNPNVDVGFGEQTWDEMMIGYFQWWRAD
jgi:hypothetical protein